jgi:hypothetical protein
MAAQRLSTGDVIYLAVVPDCVEEAEETVSFLHSDGYADFRLGTADEYGGAQRAYNFRECLFEVTNQLQYGAQQELLECKKKFLGAIYSSIREIKSQIVVVDRLLMDEQEAREPTKPPSKTEQLLQAYKRDLKRNLQAVQDESVDAARDFEDNGLKIRDENKRVAETREQKDRRRGWSALVGGWKPGQASTSSVFPNRLGPFGQETVPAADLPTFSFVHGPPGKAKTSLVVKYRAGLAGWQREWGKSECFCSDLDDISLSDVVRRGLGIHENAKSFAWVYPSEALMAVNDQSKIDFAMRGPQSSLLAFGGYVYFDLDKAAMAQQQERAVGKLLSANAVVTAANAPSKRKLQFRPPRDIPSHKMREAAKAHEFRHETVRSKQAHATSFVWIGPGRCFGDLKTEHGAFVYYCIKGDGLWFDILTEETVNEATTETTNASSSSSPSSASLPSLPSPRRTLSSSSLHSVLKSQSLHFRVSQSELFADEAHEELCTRGLKQVTEVDWNSWSAKVRYMAERVKKEQEKNEHLQEDKMQSGVMFGQAIQLRHVKSGRFLEVKTRDGSAELADVEKDTQCYKVELAPHGGSEGSWFHFRAFRRNLAAAGTMHTEKNASPVFINNEVLLQSSTLSNFQLHSSRALPPHCRQHLAFDAHRTEVNLANFSTHIASSAAAAADARPKSPGRAETPTQEAKCEGEEPVDEEGRAGEEAAAAVALESNGGGGYVWRLHRYSRRPALENKAFIQLGQALRLYHPSAEAFIVASADKGSKAMNNAHGCYLQSLGINGGSFNPDDSSNQSAKQIFVLESGDDEIGFQQHGGTATWQSVFRFRHVASGKYLMAGEAAPERSGSIHDAHRGRCSTNRGAGVSPLSTKSPRLSGKGEQLWRSPSRTEHHSIRNHGNDTSGHGGCYVPVLVHLCHKPVSERDVFAWSQTKFRLTSIARIESQIPLSSSGGIQYLQDICIKVAESAESESQNVGFWLSTDFQRKERGSHSFVGDPNHRRKAPNSQNNSSFDQEKTKGLAMHFATDELDHNASNVQASFVDEDYLRRVETTLAQRAALRTLYTPGKWGSTLGQQAETTMLQKDPRKADELLKALLQTMISELLDQR